MGAVIHHGRLGTRSVVFLKGILRGSGAVKVPSVARDAREQLVDVLSEARTGQSVNERVDAGVRIG